MLARRPEDGEAFNLRDGHVLVLRGRGHDRAPGHRLGAALVSYLRAVLATDRLQSQAAAAGRLSPGQRPAHRPTRAVSHDLRTPLASGRSPRGGWRDVRGLSDAQTHDSMAAIDLEAQRLEQPG